MLRKLLKEQLEAVQKGADPLGTIRDPAANHIIELDVRNERMGLFGPANQVEIEGRKTG